MEDTRVTFKTAKLAKEKGFPQEPNRLKIPYYNYKGEFKGDVTDFLRKYLKKEDTSDVESVSAPTQSLIAKLLREKHNIIVLVLYDGKTFYYQIQRKEWEDCIIQFDLTLNQTYEEAYEIGLQEALKLI